MWFSNGTKILRPFFSSLRKPLFKSPVLIGPNFLNNFQNFPFSSNDIITCMLLQKIDQDGDQPIAFMSKVFKDSEFQVHYHGKLSLFLGQVIQEF